MLRLRIKRAPQFSITPTLTWTSNTSTNSPVVNAAVPIGYMVSGDGWQLQFAQDLEFSSPTQIAGTVNSTDAMDADISALSGVTLPDGINYARFRILRDATPATNWSNIPSLTINAPPAMTSTDLFHTTEGGTSVGTLTATQSCTFAISGTDAAFFQMTGSTLQFVSAPDFSTPEDANADNEYSITITPTAIHDSEVGPAQNIIVQVEPIGDYPETTAFLARSVTSGGTVSSRLDATHIAAVKAFMNGLQYDNIWTNFDAIYLIATQSIGTGGQDIAKMNLMQDAYNLTSSSMTFVADRGATDTGGSSAYVTGFTPSTAGGLYSLNDAHLSIWGNGTNGTRSDIGYSNGGPHSGIGMNSTGTILALNQTGGGTSVGVSAGNGFLWGQRTASNAQQAYSAVPNIGAVSLLGASTTASTSLSTGPITVGAIAGQNNSGRQISAASIGKSMSAADIEKYYDRLQAYMTAVGN
jgi:hypothetical protein